MNVDIANANPYKEYTHWKNAEIPIVIGVSAHRNIDKRYTDVIEKRVSEFLDEIIALCPHTPVYMLTGLAQGGDLLCAQVAIKKGIKIMAALPFETCDGVAYDNETDFDEDGSLQAYRNIVNSEHVVKKFVVPDTEQIPPENDPEKRRVYLFRQQAIYVATNSHILLALWDGTAPENTQRECGTNVTVHFALEHNFYRPNGMEFFSSYDGVAVAIFSPRETGKYAPFVESDFVRQYIAVNAQAVKKKDVIADSVFTRGKEACNITAVCKMPQSLQDTLVRTDAYNEDYIAYCKSLAKKSAQESVYYLVNENVYADNKESQAVHDCYMISSSVSSKNKNKYLTGIKLLSVFGLLLILAWMLYDQIEFRWTCVLCALMLLVLAIVYVAINFAEATKLAVKFKLMKKFDAHAKFIEYRALSETMRVQYYLLSLGLNDNASSLFTWAHKSEMTWVKMAVTVYLIGIAQGEWRSDIENEVFEEWIGKNKTVANKSNNGQLGYHLKNSEIQRKKIANRDTTNKLVLIFTFVSYVALFAAELFGFVDLDKTLFWVINARILLKCCLSLLAAITFVVSYNYGQLSLDQNLNDSVHMTNLYSVAFDRINAIRTIYATDAEKKESEMRSLVRELARNQLIENGTWVAYNKDNGNDVPI